MPATSRTPRRRVPQDHNPPRKLRPAPRDGGLDLDALERDGRPEPFIAYVGDESFEFADPFEFDWQDAVAIDPNDIHGSLKSMLGEQYQAFLKHRMPMWKLRALSEAVEKHYASSLGNAGEGDASPAS